MLYSKSEWPASSTPRCCTVRTTKPHNHCDRLSMANSENRWVPKESRFRRTYPKRRRFAMWPKTTRCATLPVRSLFMYKNENARWSWTFRIYDTNCTTFDRQLIDAITVYGLTIWWQSRVVLGGILSPTIFDRTIKFLRFCPRSRGTRRALENFTEIGTQSFL